MLHELTWGDNAHIFDFGMLASIRLSFAENEWLSWEEYPIVKESTKKSAEYVM